MRDVGWRGGIRVVGGWMEENGRMASARRQACRRDPLGSPTQSLNSEWGNHLFICSASDRAPGGSCFQTKVTEGEGRNKKNKKKKKKKRGLGRRDV